MNLGRYGPFADVVALGSALVASFSVLLLKMLGGVKRWTWLTSGSPPFLVTAGARVVAVALMAVTYVTISKENYRYFAGAAVLLGLSGLYAIVRFDRLRKLHVVSIPIVCPDGSPLFDRNKKPVEQNVVVGLESQLRDEARTALADARKAKGGLSVRQFMSGYGAQRVNDPEALWDSALLAGLSNSLTTALIWILLLAVMTLFLSAFVIEAAGR